MKILTRNILSVGIALVLALPTLAQKPLVAKPSGALGTPGAPGQGGGRGQGQRGGRGAYLAMLPVSMLDMITPLKADQKTKITAIQDKVKADLKTADRTARGGIMSKGNEDIKAILTSAQTADVEKALPSLMLISMSRAIPMGALGDVKLTKSQMTKIQGFTTAVSGQMKDLKGDERRTKMQQVGPQLKTQIEGVLTTAQKDTIAKYEAAHPRGQRGGPGGPGGPGSVGGLSGPGGAKFAPGGQPGGPKKGK